MIEWGALALIYFTLGMLIYSIVRYRGKSEKYWGWYLANGVAWMVYGYLTMDNGWHWAWNMAWGFLFGMQLTNAVMGLAKANREKAEDQW